MVILDANTATLSGVYTYAFLSLMALFAFGCMLLKTKRAELPRDIHAPWWSCILGFLFMIAGIFANLLGDPKILMVFAFYLIAVVAIMMAMLERVTILKVTLSVMKTMLPSRSQLREEPVKDVSRESPSFSDYAAVSEFVVLEIPSASTVTDSTISTGARGGRTIAKAILDINEQPIIFFCKRPDLRLLNKAILYVRKNEQTHNVRVVHVSTNDDQENGEAESIHEEFKNQVALFANIYPKLRIDFIQVHGDFEPAVVKWLSQTLKVPLNLMFIAQPGDTTVHRVSKIGVRVITG